MPPLGDLSPAGSVAIGIIVGLLSTSIQSVGLTLQRKSHLLEDEKEDELVRRPPYRRRRWQLGMFMFIISNLVGSTIQITTLPLPVLSTLQASGLVFNTICATLLLGEPFTRWSLYGTVLVAAGAVLIAMFGAIPEPSHTLKQLLFLLGRKQFILWMAFSLFLIIAVLIASWVLSRLPTANTPKLRLLRGMCFGFVSSILSAHSLLMAKSAVELLVRTIVDHVNQFDRWQSWMILLALLFLALTQLYFLHRGLKLCSTSVLYPFVFCIYNIVAILDGLIYFKQTDRLPPLHAGLITLGTVILLAGVLALSWRLGDEDSVAPPADAHTLLTPGMGLVEDTTTEDEADGSLFSYDSQDEEAALHASERSPLLRLMTPTSKDNAILRLTRHRRQSVGKSRESQGIWDELHDNDNPINSRHLRDLRLSRRASTATYAAKKPLSAEHANADDVEEDADVGTDEEDAANPLLVKKRARFLKRHKRSQTISIGSNITESDTEVDGNRQLSLSPEAVERHRGTPFSTASLHARHLYDQRRRQKWSPRHRTGSSIRGRPGSLSSLQNREESSPNGNADLYDEDERQLDGSTEAGTEDMLASYGTISSTGSRRLQRYRGVGDARARRNSSLMGLLWNWWNPPPPPNSLARTGSFNASRPQQPSGELYRRRAQTLPAVPQLDGETGGTGDGRQPDVGDAGGGVGGSSLLRLGKRGVSFTRSKLNLSLTRSTTVSSGGENEGHDSRVEREREHESDEDPDLTLSVTASAPLLATSPQTAEGSEIHSRTRGGRTLNNADGANVDATN